MSLENPDGRSAGSRNDRCWLVPPLVATSTPSVLSGPINGSNPLRSFAGAVAGVSDRCALACRWMDGVDKLTFGYPVASGRFFTRYEPSR